MRKINAVWRGLYILLMVVSIQINVRCAGDCMYAYAPYPDLDNQRHHSALGSQITSPPRLTGTRPPSSYLWTWKRRWTRRQSALNSKTGDWAPWLTKRNSQRDIRCQECHRVGTVQHLCCRQPQTDRSSSSQCQCRMTSL